MSGADPRRRLLVRATTNGRLALSRTLLVAVLARPDLWWVACRTVGRLAPDRWWARWPFLPLPDPHYWSFRMQTALGSAPTEPGTHAAERAGVLSSDDVADFLEWCRRMPAPDR